MNDYKGVIIEESLSDNSVLDDVKILKTKVEEITPKHQTPWLKQWTLYTVEIPEGKAEGIAQKLSKVLDYSRNSSWYADFKNDQFAYIIFKNKIFKIRQDDAEGFKKAREHGISLGIPEYQVDFVPNAKVWES
ncbi:MAG: hypothetical protein Q7R49_05075 [Candidatus Daviesbacteria bacterium]|nr:hypothetical protein [Candidatus Daviesbacteria bacterium]